MSLSNHVEMLPSYAESTGLPNAAHEKQKEQWTNNITSLIHWKLLQWH